MLILLEDERTGTLADHKTVAVHVERTRSVRGIVVARRKRLHRIESPDSRLVHRSLRAAGNHHVGLAVANGIESGDHAVVRRCAGRNRTIVRAHEAVLHGDEACSDVGDHAGNKERAKPRGSIPSGIAQTLIEERFESSDTRAPDNTDLLLIDRLEIEGRILHGLRGRDQGILREKVVLADLLAVEILCRVVILYFTGKTCLKFFRIEMSNGRCTADSLLQIRKILLNTVAERVDRPDARHYYSSFRHDLRLLAV